MSASELRPHGPCCASAGTGIWLRSKQAGRRCIMPVGHWTAGRHWLFPMIHGILVFGWPLAGSVQDSIATWDGRWRVTEWVRESSQSYTYVCMYVCTWRRQALGGFAPVVWGARAKQVAWRKTGKGMLSTFAYRLTVVHDWLREVKCWWPTKLGLVRLALNPCGLSGIGWVWIPNKSKFLRIFSNPIQSMCIGNNRTRP
jgi:hypothetical protein